MPETTLLIKAALNLRVGAVFDVYELCVSQNAINKQRGRILQKLRKILQNLSF